MSLTVPTSDDLYAFWGDQADTSDPDRADTILELSADLLWMATGLEDDPTDSRLSNLVQFAICDMAIYMYVTRDDIDADYSPFLSERIGSYSYAKTYSRMASAINNKKPTSVPLFDKVVDYLTDAAYTKYGWGCNTRIPSLFRESIALDPTWGPVWGRSNPDYEYKHGDW